MKDLTIIIVNWNVKDLLIQCLNSIYQNIKGFDCEVFVVDNASTDGSVEAVSDNFPGVRLILNEKNHGFAAANNQAIKLCTGKYILLLNPDTLIKGDALKQLLDFLKNNKDCGIVGPKLLNQDGTLQPSCRNYISVSNLIIQHMLPENRIFSKLREKMVFEYWDHSATREVDWIIGACLMCPAELIDSIGPLDEKIFIYHEDTDWCYRAKKKGWKVCFVHSAEVVHYGNQSGIQVWNEKTVLQYYKAKHYFINKHYGGFSLFMHRSLISALFIARIISLLSSGLMSGKLNDNQKESISLYLEALSAEIGHRNKVGDFNSNTVND